MNDPLVIDCTPEMAKLLDTLVGLGFFGPSRETAAQRLLEAKMFETMLQFIAAGHTREA